MNFEIEKIYYTVLPGKFWYSNHFGVYKWKFKSYHSGGILIFEDLNREVITEVHYNWAIHNISETKEKAIEKYITNCEYSIEKIKKENITK